MDERCVSVVIPTYNRPDVLEGVLRSYLQQPECGEVIVVDDGSSAEYESAWPAIRGAGRQEGVPVVIQRHARRRGASAARNTGIRLARLPFVMTTDDDIDLSKDYMNRCLRVFREAARAGYVGGRVVYLQAGESAEAARSRAIRQRHPYCDLATLTVCFWGHCDGPTRVPLCSAVGIWDRRVFEDGVRYDPGYRGNAYREESDPQLAAQTLGYAVMYHPDAFAFHLPPPQINARSAGQHRKGRLWYEYWAMRNNIRFLEKYAPFLKQQWHIKPWKAAINFELMRIKQGARKVFRKIRRAA